MKRRVFAPTDTGERVIVYKDEQNDEFSEAIIEARRIDGSYKYDRCLGIGALLGFFWYRMIATPTAYIYLKLKFSHRIVGRELLEQSRGQSIFIYGNHTQATADALIPTFITMPKKAYVIVHPNNVSMPLLGRVTPYMGAIPLPDDMKAARNFSCELKRLTEKKSPIVIYPEAHIWPYYTGIRPFGEASFAYPVKYESPVYCFTNTYVKRKHRAKPGIVTYIDGPFMPDMSLPIAQRKKELRDRVYQTMCRRAKSSCVEYIKYIKQNDECEEGQ